MDKAALKEALREMIRDGELGIMVEVVEYEQDNFTVKVALTIDHSEIEDSVGRAIKGSDTFWVDVPRED